MCNSLCHRLPSPANNQSRLLLQAGDPNGTGFCSKQHLLHTCMLNNILLTPGEVHCLIAEWQVMDHITGEVRWVWALQGPVQLVCIVPYNGGTLLQQDELGKAMQTSGGKHQQSVLLRLAGQYAPAIVLHAGATGARRFFQCRLHTLPSVMHSSMSLAPIVCPAQVDYETLCLLATPEHLQPPETLTVALPESLRA